MKTISSIILWGASLCALHAQVDTSDLQYKRDQMFAQLTVPTGLLFEKSFAISEFDFRKGSRTDSVSCDEYTQTVLDIYQSAYNKSNMLTTEQVGQIDGKNTAKGRVAMGLLAYNYNYIDSAALRLNLVSFANNKFYDVANRPNSPYKIETMFVAAPTHFYEGSNIVNFILEPQLVKQNIGTITNILFDAGDGAGNRPLSIGTVLTINYSTIGLKYLKYTVNFSNGKQLKCTSAIHIKSNGINWSNVQQQLNAKGYVSGSSISERYYQLFLDKVTGPFVKSDYNPTLPFGNDITALVSVIFGKNKTGGEDTILDKPMIFVEGIDLDKVEFDQVDRFNNNEMKFGGLGFYDFYNLNPDYPQVIKGQALFQQLFNQGYDLFYVDFGKSNEKMQYNGDMLIRLIDFINAKKIGNEEIVTGGGSMGGQVLRYALAKMEHYGQKTCTREYISFDSPHQGADIPQALQNYIKFNRNFFEKSKKLATRLESPAAQQLLYWHYLDGYDNTYRSEWLADRNSFNVKNGLMGYPHNMRRVAIINGSDQGIYNAGNMPGYNSGDRVFTQKNLNRATLGVLSIIFFPAAAVTAVFTNEARGYAMPGGNQNWLFQNCANNERTIYRSQNIYGVPKNKVCGDMNDHSYDVAAGCFNNTYESFVLRLLEKKNLKFAARLWDITSVNHGFIPSISALDVNCNNDFGYDIFTNITNNIPLRGKDKPAPGIHPWDAYYANEGHYNERHVEITDGATQFQFQTVYNLETLPRNSNNMDWFVKEIEKNRNIIRPQLNTVYNYGSKRNKLYNVVVQNGGTLHINKYDKTDYSLNPSLNLPAPNTALTGLLQDTYGDSTKNNSTYVMTTNERGSVIEVQSGGKLVLGDMTHGNKAEVYIKAGSTININAGAILEIQDGSQLIIEAGAALNIQNGAIIRLMGLNSKLEYKANNIQMIVPNGTNAITFTKHTAAQGGKFLWNGGLSWAGGSNNKLISNGVYLRCNGQVTFNNGNKLELQGSEACLDIAGTLNLGTNAKFTFTKGTATDGGYVKFSNPTLVTTPYGQSSPATITAAAGASMEFIGAGKTDKVLEVNQFWVLIPNNLSGFKIQNGLVENTASSGFGELVVPCSLTVSNAQFITYNTTNVNSRGIELYGQYHSIDNSEFRNFKEGAIFYGDYYNNPLKVTNCIFQGCRLGIMGYKDGGLNLVGNSFTNNYRGVEMSNATLASNVQSNIFKNTNYENTNGSAHGNLFYLLNTNETDSFLLMANGPNQSHCGIKYKGTSDLYLFNNTLKGLRAGVITENNKVNLQCNNFVNIQNAGIITIAGTLNMSAKTNNAGHNLISNIGFTLFRLYNVQESKILLNSGFNQFKVHNSNVEVNQDFNSFSAVSDAFNIQTPMGTGRMASYSAATNNAIGTQNKLLTQQKMKLPMAMYGSAISTNPQVNVYTQLSMNRNKWDVLNSTPFYVAGSNLQNLSNLVTPSFPDYNPSLPFITIDNFSLSQAKSCGDTTAPCNTPGCLEAQRVAATCSNCDNVATQEIGVAQTNVAANNAMNKMEDLTVTNRYKKSLSIFTDVESNATALQGIEDQAVLDYVHEGTITALSEGLRKKQINLSNAVDKAKLSTLENAYSNQIAALTSPNIDKKMEQISLMRNKAHVQHLQNKSDLAMNTIDAAISKIQADVSLTNAVELQSLLLEKCFYDIAHQYNTGQLAKEYFSIALEACKANIIAGMGLNKSLGDNTEFSFDPTLEMLQAPAEMPLVKEPPYRSYVNEDQQGYYDETQLAKAGLISVMPNPAQNRITILAKEELGTCTITFTDMSGRLLISKTITLNQNAPVGLDLDLNNGIYLYTISHEGTIIDKNKLIVIGQE